MTRFLIAALVGLFLATSASAQSNLPLNLIKLPPGFKISVFAQVPNARSMAVVPELNAVFVGNRRGHRLFVATGLSGGGAASNVAQIAGGLKSPNGIAWKDGRFYVAEQHRVFRLKVPSLDSSANIIRRHCSTSYPTRAGTVSAILPLTAKAGVTWPSAHHETSAG
ncbi:MAG: hypothetical protein VW169_04975 [Rhodospirillaceae bacterium]